MKRTLIVGWDSADFSIVDPMLRAGKLPNLARLIKEGVRGPLESTFLPNSFPGWTSFMTGVNPGKHGIYHAVNIKENSYATVPVNSSQIQVRTMWDYLSDENRQVVVINVPVTYPPPKVNGCLVSSILTPSLQHRWTYPEELASEILENTGGYIIDARHSWRRKKETLEETEECVRLRKEAALYLMREKPWDVFCVVFTSLDRIQHCFWGDRDPKHPGHNPKDAAIFGDAFERTYIMLDEALGELLKEAGSGTDVLIVSDHGTGPLYHTLHMNMLLEQTGFLKIKREMGRRVTFRTMTSRASALLNKVVMKLKNQPRSVEDTIGTFASKLERSHQQMKSFADSVDWSRTKAFFTPVVGIRLNITGREPHGSVDPSRREQTIRELKSRLLKIPDPVNSGPLFEDLVMREDVFHGPALDSSPDLLPVLSSPNVKPDSATNSSVLMSPDKTGGGFHLHHYRQGVLVAAGPSIRHGETGDARLMDIAPTVLHMAGLDIPRHMDGRVLRIFAKGSGPASRKPMRADLPSEPREAGFATGRDDEDIITERLKGLGYI